MFRPGQDPSHRELFFLGLNLYCCLFSVISHFLGSQRPAAFGSDRRGFEGVPGLRLSARAVFFRRARAAAPTPVGPAGRARPVCPLSGKGTGRFCFKGTVLPGRAGAPVLGERAASDGRQFPAAGFCRSLRRGVGGTH